MGAWIRSEISEYQPTLTQVSVLDCGCRVVGGGAVSGFSRIRLWLRDFYFILFVRLGAITVECGTVIIEANA